MSEVYDVVIVGAGAAGLSAARQARETGLSFKVFEAKNRIGGRTFTDTTSLGMTWDRGAHWLHSADVNPLTKIADELGHPYHRQEGSFYRHLFLGRKAGKPVWADEETYEAYRAEFESAYDVAHVQGEAGEDIPVSRTLDPDTRFNRITRHLFQAICGADPEDLCAVDFARYSDTEKNWPLERGYGALIAALFADIPVTLSCPVRRIDMTDAHVKVATDDGVVEAKSVIVTVSTNVLASGAIRFLPQLPASLQEALDGVPTGHANKVAFAFRRDIFGLPEKSHALAIDERKPARSALSFQIRPFGQNMAIAYYGGSEAADLERAGRDVMIAHARGMLGDMFGTGIFKEMSGVEATAWTTDPHMLGAYSYGKPGKADMRARLSEPVGDRLFLAGEAVPLDWYSTVHGAYESGISAAQKAAHCLGRGVAGEASA
ncbi:monoamine oxidase [Parvibaculum indicum]|uniref:flavin monoamine oxidase family protein n=1 Tax=Parvibaculum indicum TaxID=562969 RepID=UPI00141DAF6C|nr:NAD(P)/FAD-dependent oxidoreductase [Parvibaculum indicum]NIJ41036.1 monoamine oxidase [Parvibaculum indicum]